MVFNNSFHFEYDSCRGLGDKCNITKRQVKVPCTPTTGIFYINKDTDKTSLLNCSETLETGLLYLRTFSLCSVQLVKSLLHNENSSQLILPRKRVDTSLEFTLNFQITPTENRVVAH